MSFEVTLVPFLLLVGGLCLLVAGGELLVRSSVRLAAYYGISPLVIGLTVVAFGTSAPELAVSVQAVRTGASALALGNVIGSNIFNVLFILGASALLAPLVVSRRVVWVEVPIVVAISVLALALASDGRLGTWDGLLLLLVVAGYTTWLLRTTRSDAPASTPDPQQTRARPVVTILMAAGGLGLLVVGAQGLVSGAATFARLLGVDDAIIGLTIVAAGTSLPEVAASLVATMRGERDIAIGNVLGSNIFNFTAILGTATLAGGGIPVAPGLVTFDFIVAVGVAVACLPIFYTGHRIDRWEGVLFLGYYVAYVAYLVLDATGHEALPQFRNALLLFALPLTGVTLVVLAGRAAWLRHASGR